MANRLSFLGSTRVVVPLCGAALGILPMLLFVLQFGGRTRWSVLGFSVVLALAAAMVGALLGFLFGVPRYARDPATGADPAASGRSAEGQWDHNTNLEQVSDWLTKVLVGVGLTQFRSIGNALGSLLDELRPGLGAAESSSTFGGVVIAYFGALGFIVGYIFTVVYLPGLLAKRRRKVMEAMR